MGGGGGVNTTTQRGGIPGGGVGGGGDSSHILNNTTRSKGKGRECHCVLGEIPHTHWTPLHKARAKEVLL